MKNNHEVASDAVEQKEALKFIYQFPLFVAGFFVFLIGIYFLIHEHFWISIEKLYISSDGIIGSLFSEAKHVSSKVIGLILVAGMIALAVRFFPGNGVSTNKTLPASR